MNWRWVCSVARSRATSPLNASANWPSSSVRAVCPRSSRPLGAIRAARCAMSVIGRRPIDASHIPPAAASTNAIGMPTSIASSPSRCSRRTSESGLPTIRSNVIAPNVRRRADSRQPPPFVSTVHARRSVAAAQRLVNIEPVPASRQHGAALVEDREPAAGCVDRAGRLGRGGGRVVLLVQLVLDDVLERGQQPGQLAVHATDADPLLLPQDGGGEYAQHDQQRERVPQREPRPQRTASSRQVGPDTS